MQSLHAANPIKIVFRVDASASLGGGHVTRCLALADLLKNRGARCWFACTPETVATVPALQRSAHDVLELIAPGDAKDFSAAVSGVGFKKFDWLIVDHYGWDALQETACRSLTEKIFVIDDLANRPHDCDVLLDQTYGRNPSDYDRLVPAACAKLIGPSFALLRPEFAAARAQSLLKRKSGKLNRVLVSMGLTDAQNATLLVLQGIQKSKLPLTVDVVLGAAAPHAQSVKQLAEMSGGSIVIHQDPPSMSALMTNADLAFGAGGSSSWERCALGLPSVIIVVADNQKEVAVNLSRRSAIKLLGEIAQVKVDAIVEALHALYESPDDLTHMATCAAMICDARGINRTEMQIQPVLAKDGKTVSLRPVTLADVEITFQWQSEPNARKFSRDPNPPAWSEHKTWFEQRLLDPYTLFSIIMFENLVAGVLRLDLVDKAEFEVSIMVSSELHGLGIAHAALMCAAKLVPEATLRAEVLTGNSHSEMLFNKAGFVPKGFGSRHLLSLDSRLH